jgi:hypothetical protein
LRVELARHGDTLAVDALGDDGEPLCVRARGHLLGVVLPQLVERAFVVRQ